MTSWWQSIWEWLVGTEPRPARPTTVERASAPLWIEPVEERAILGLFAAQ